MSVTLIDTNVLLDIVTNDADWVDWSVTQLERAATRGQLVVNDIIYAELSVRFATIEAVESLVDNAGIVVAAIPRAALFLAGKVFQRYRASGGTRRGVLPDFFIGAHAAVAGLTLLSRDSGRYRTYFPALDLVTPGSNA